MARIPETKTAAPATQKAAVFLGRDERIRTSDPHTPSLKIGVLAQVYVS
jgi:hypothetical protein